MLAKFTRMQRMLAGMLATVRGDLLGICSVFEGQTWHQKPVAKPGRPGMFWGPNVSQVRPPPLRGKHRTYRVFCIFPRVSVGLGRAAGDAFVGLIGCETHVAGARAGPKRRTQAGTCTQARVGECMLSVRGVGQATLQPLARLGSQRARAWVGSRCVGSSVHPVPSIPLCASHAGRTGCSRRLREVVTTVRSRSGGQSLKQGPA